MNASESDSTGMSAELLPIREVARLTGVNPVTLRAWERRYGLVQPQRTPKGHRLYSSAQVARIQVVLTWLERGVAVGQVKALLNQPAPAEPATSSLWSEQQTLLIGAVEQLAESVLDEHVNHAMALYPPATLYQQLLLPLLNALEQRWYRQPNATLEQGFFYTWLRTKLSTRIYHTNRLCSGKPLLLINLDVMPMAPEFWLCAWLASSADFPLQVIDWPLAAADLGVAMNHLEPCAVLLYGSRKLEPEQLDWLQQGNALRLLCGRAACFHQTGLSGERLHLFEDPLAAVQALQRLCRSDHS